MSRITTKFVVLAMATVAVVAASPLASGASTTIVQGPPTAGATDVAGSASYIDFLTAPTGSTGAVTFTTSTPDFAIINGNELETAGTLSTLDSPYTVSGDDSDGSGDIGTWSYVLSVTADPILQGVPIAGSTTAANSATFTDTLAASAGFVGAVSFTTSTPDFAIINGDELETTSALSASGSPYTVTGTDADAYGNTGSWSYVLTVTPSGSPPPTPGPAPAPAPSTLTQTSPKTGTTSTASSAAFTAGPISVAGGTGTVTFVTTSSSPALIVSPSGLISTTGLLDTGTYIASGTDSDTHGDTGTWSYALTVTLTVTVIATSATVTFRANGGRGTMSPEQASAPTALSLNRFTRRGYTFVGWNTSAKGPGVSYANGSLYSFDRSTNLFARWKKGTVPYRTLTFRANEGKGVMRSEIENAPTVISADRFTRAGYKFVDWNTKPNGTGHALSSGTTYPFTKSLILYAQWKKIVKVPTKKPTKTPKKPSYEVLFAANGGTGSMTAERHTGPAVLTPNDFRRSGYAFAEWNTRPNGSGTTYTNGARYSFDASVTLYAEWKKVTFTTPPFTVPGGVTIGEFARGSSSLSSGLKSQIQNLAHQMKTKSDTQVTLYGFGDEAASANAADLALGRQRAESVASYLEARLTTIGLKGFTISIAPETPSANEVGTVVAALS